MNRLLDFHTHRPDAEHAVISVDPRRFDPRPGLWYSVGYHPWDVVDLLGDESFELLRQYSRHPQVLAIGETGLDALKGADMAIQEAVYARHLSLAATVGKPVVVHSVRTARQILDLRRKMHLDDVMLAIHGMRGNEHVARMYLDAGCYLSFGIRFNPAALRITPHDRLLIETDDSAATIDEVATAVSSALGMSDNELKETAAANLGRLFVLS